MDSNSQSQQDETTRLWPKFLERVVDPVTWFTLALVILAHRQWKVYERQAALMSDGLIETKKAADAAQQSATVARDALISSERPFVGSEIHVRCGKDPRDGKTLGFALQTKWINTGHRSAMNMQQQTALVVVKPGVDVAFTPQNDQFRQSTPASIGPGQTVWSDPIELSMDHVRMIEKGEAVAYLFGYAEYRDVIPDAPVRHTCFLSRVTVLPRVDPTRNDNPFHFPGHGTQYNYLD